MNETLKLVTTLTIVCLLSALLLSLVNSLTVERINEKARIEMLNAVTKSLPRDILQYNNDPSKDILIIKEWKGTDDKPKEIYVGKKNNKPVGFAFTSTGEGYGGTITLMIGIDVSGKVTGIEIVEHNETPGLGANIESSKDFRDQFKNKGSNQEEFIVIKGRKPSENFEIEAITGATISSRGVVQAINDGLAKFNMYKKYLIGS
ncbi:MAG: RnfABCDGE type electron transport complex subunit G [bacterium]